MNELVRSYTQDIKDLIGQASYNILAIGEKLIAVKKQLVHGDFVRWLDDEFEWDVRTAQRMMLVAQRFKNDNLSLLPIEQSAMYLLAEKATPDAFVANVIEVAREGTVITHSKAKQMLATYKELHTPAPASPAPEPPSTPAPPPRHHGQHPHRSRLQQRQHQHRGANHRRLTRPTRTSIGRSGRGIRSLDACTTASTATPATLPSAAILKSSRQLFTLTAWKHHTIRRYQRKPRVRLATATSSCAPWLTSLASGCHKSGLTPCWLKSARPRNGTSCFSRNFPSV